MKCSLGQEMLIAQMLTICLEPDLFLCVHFWPFSLVYKCIAFAVYRPIHSTCTCSRTWCSTLKINALVNGFFLWKVTPIRLLTLWRHVARGGIEQEL